MSIHRRLLTAALVASALLLFACDTYPPSEPFDASEIPGRYRATFGDDVDYIDVHADSTYEHVYVYSDGSRFVDSGSWNLDERETKGYFWIDLDRFVERYPMTPLAVYDPKGVVDTSRQYKSGTYTFKKLRDTLQIVIRPLENMRYVKVN